jgi:hypothetical protein
MLRIAPCVRHFGVLAVLCGAASLASAQWAWRDEHGRTVYSDQPPPATVRAKDVLRQPASAPPNESSDSNNADAPSASNPAAAPSPSSRAAPAAPQPPTMAERELEFRKRQKERAEAEKKLADAQAEAARKAEDCERARGYMRSLDDGVRLLRTNPDGSRELLDEAQRAAEIQRTQQIIQSRCN